MVMLKAIHVEELHLDGFHEDFFVFFLMGGEEEEEERRGMEVA